MPHHHSQAALAQLLCTLLALVWFSGCSSAPDKRILQYLNADGFGKRYVGNPEEEDYVALGDQVSYEDKLNPQVRGQEQVAIDGTIIIPEVGAVHVAGYTRTEIEALLTDKFSPYFARNELSVEIKTGKPEFFIFGEVAAPGRKTFMGDYTIFEAVFDNSPKEHTANLGRVKIIRADPQDPYVQVVNVADMLRSGDSTFNVQIQEYDIVVVPPTLLAQFGYFLSDLLFPFTEVFKSVFQGLLSVSKFSNYGNNKSFSAF